MGKEKTTAKKKAKKKVQKKKPKKKAPKKKAPAKKKAPKRKTLSYLTKLKVAASQKWRCKICDRLFDEHSLFEIDHIKPYSIFKNDEVYNLQALHPSCHSAKTLIEKQRIIDYKNGKKVTFGNQMLAEHALKFHSRDS
jgi:CRISPR/Cas system Type II protein with McrA/HNH and RuvC-like nuclease domain